MRTNLPVGSVPSELRQALKACRGAFLFFALFSAVLNILALTGSLFMLEIYDRVIPSGSIQTLVGLLVLVVALYGFQGVLDVIRGRLLARIALRLDQLLAGRISSLIVRLPLQAPLSADGIQPVRDFDTIRGYLSGRGPTVFFDLPWLPFYLAVCFAFHVLIGLTVLAGAIVLLALTLLSERLARQPVRETARSGAERLRMAETIRRNALALTALGMTERLYARWQAAHERHLLAQLRANDVTDGLGAVGRVFRMMLQSTVLAVGAYLVINQEATAGIIISASILSARALAPVDLAIAQWKGFAATHQAMHRLEKLLELSPLRKPSIELPAPTHTLAVENVTITLPQTQRAILQDVSFTLKRGSGLGIIGPSASGKSSLVRVLVGLWMPARGTVRLDGATLDQWQPETMGRYIGYLPQDIELIEGTVGENIARFDPDATPERILEAAKAAGVHDLAVHLPQGYDTPVGEQGRHLSGGQQQRIALARALYGNPFLVILDEPNANLDAEGDEALSQAILDVRARGGIVIIVSHRPSALAGVDQVLTLSNGRQRAFGPKNEVLSRVLRRGPPEAKKAVVGAAP